MEYRHRMSTLNVNIKKPKYKQSSCHYPLLLKAVVEVKINKQKKMKLEQIKIKTASENQSENVLLGNYREKLQ